MCMGIGGWIYKKQEDETTVIFSYGTFDWNRPEYHNDEKICDGVIRILKKEIPDSDTRITDMLNSGTMEFKNCSNCWKTANDIQIDVMLIRLLAKLFRCYDAEKQFPDKISYVV